MAALFLRSSVSLSIRRGCVSNGSLVVPHDVINFSTQLSGGSAFQSNQQIAPCLLYRHLHSTPCHGSAPKTVSSKVASSLKTVLAKKRKVIDIWRNMTVNDLANSVNETPKKVLSVIKEYIQGGHFYRSPNDAINDIAVSREVSKLLGLRTRIVSTPDFKLKEDGEKDAYPRPAADPECLVKRPPVVTVMGHVDHGKTTLLDSLRNSNVVAGEFGGITQHIGAFCVKVGDGQKVTFIDTPGHAAFTSMRSRGALCTDIVVLVVAADDGVMEQTIESIRMANEAQVPVIVAINKVDKPEANIRRTEEMLAQHGIITENMGGEVQAIPVSALKKINLDTLTEAILLQSEIMDLQADPGGFVEGVILESRQDPHRGKIASALIQRGTLRKGAILVAGTAHAKVRLIFDEDGKHLQDAPPSTPVEMMGWRELPFAGDMILEVESERRAQEVIQYRVSKMQRGKEDVIAEEITKRALEHREKQREKRITALQQGRFSIKEARKKEFIEDHSPRVKLVIKGDVAGSVEAILDVLETYHSDDVPLEIVHYGVGDATENDVELAVPFNAIIYCFNVKTPAKVQQLAAENGVDVRNVNVIYRLVEDLKQEISKKLPVKNVEEVIGEADVLQQFVVNEKRKKLVVAGAKVSKGTIVKDGLIRLIRNNEVLFDGNLSSLRHEKNEVRSIKNGLECGLMLGDPTIPVKHGDTIVCYKVVQKTVEVNWDPGF